jgi:PAS domain S-box-containing protein
MHTWQTHVVHLKAAVQHVSDLVVVVDEELVVRFANPAVLGILGRAPAEVVGTDWLALVHPEDVIATEDWLCLIQQHAEGSRFEFRVQHRDSTWRYLEATCSRLTRGSSQGDLVITAQNTTDFRTLRERQTQALLEATLRGQEEERERICLDVHDGILQTLGLAARNLEPVLQNTMLQPVTHRRAQNAHDLVRQSVQQAREIVAWLRPARLDALGLVEALRYDVKDLAERTGLLIYFEAEAWRFPKTIETTLYRLIHEALNNVVKHARAAHVTLAFHQSEDELVAEIRDDGVGFAVNDDEAQLCQGGVGLISMRRRAELIQGRLEIHSAAKRGSVVRVTVPIGSDRGPAANGVDGNYSEVVEGANGSIRSVPGDGTPQSGRSNGAGFVGDESMATAPEGGSR